MAQHTDGKRTTRPRRFGLGETLRHIFIPDGYYDMGSQSFWHSLVWFIVLCVVASASMLLLLAPLAQGAEATYTIFQGKFVEVAGDTMTGPLIMDGTYILCDDGYLTITRTPPTLPAFIVGSFQLDGQGFLDGPLTPAQDEIWSWGSDSFKPTKVTTKDLTARGVLLVDGLSTMNGTLTINDAWLVIQESSTPTVEISPSGDADFQGNLQSESYQAGHGTPNILIESNGVDMNLDYDQGAVVGIDWTGSIGTPGAGDYLELFGDGGGYFDVPLGTSAYLVNYWYAITPGKYDAGWVGSHSQDKWFGEGAFVDLAAKTTLRIPTDIQTRVVAGDQTTYLDLDYAETPSASREWLKIGNEDRGWLTIDSYGQLDIYPHNPITYADHALRIHGSSTTFSISQDGEVATDNETIIEFCGLSGTIPGDGYDQTDEANDVVSTFGNAVPTQVMGGRVNICHVYLDIQTLRDEDYVSQIELCQRNVSDNGYSVLWSKALTLGQGDTTYHSVNYALTLAPVYRTWGFRLTSVNGEPAGQSIQYCRVAGAYELTY